MQMDIWWRDEARVGQRNGITRRWARSGTRPSAPKNQRRSSAYIYEANCPAEGKDATLTLPRCNTEGMTLHLIEIAETVAPGATPSCCPIWPGGMVLVRSSFYPTSPLCHCPPNVPSSTRPRTPSSTLGRTGSPTVYDTYDAIIDAACQTWNNPIDRPGIIRSIGMRDWTHIGQSRQPLVLVRDDPHGLGFSTRPAGMPSQPQPSIAADWTLATAPGGRYVG